MNKKEIQNLEDYMKQYEENREIKLSFVEPFVVRVRQQAYKEFCKDLNKPYDSIYSKIMVETMRQLCRELPGCKVGFVAQNEINLIFTYSNIKDYTYLRNSKTISYISSVVASKVTNIFNDVLLDEVKQQDYLNENKRQENQYVDTTKYRNKLLKAVFQVNSFNLPKERLFDYILLKHLNARRNSLVEAALAFMSDSERACKSSDEIKSILKEKFNYDYDDRNTSCRFKNGTLCVKLKDKEGTRCVLVEIPRPLKQGGNDKINIESMLFNTNRMGNIKPQYFI